MGPSRVQQDRLKCNGSQFRETNEYLKPVVNQRVPVTDKRILVAWQRLLLNINWSLSEVDPDQLECTGSQLEANWEAVKDIGSHFHSYKTQLEAVCRLMNLGGRLASV